MSVINIIVLRIVRAFYFRYCSFKWKYGRWPMIWMRTLILILVAKKI